MPFKHPTCKTPRDLLASFFDILDLDSYGEMIDLYAEGLLNDRELELQGRIPKEDNDYFLIKPEIEYLLEKRDKERIEPFMIQAKQGIIYPESGYDVLLDYDLKLLELFYREVYQDDPDYRPELIQHTDKELDEMRGR